jgi:hypothetical protein
MDFQDIDEECISWIVMLITFIVFVATGGNGVSDLLTVVFFTCFALNINKNPVA